MSELWNNFFSAGSFIPHGHCYLWKTDLVWLHIISDSLTAFAYYSIPAVLFYFVYKRRDLPFSWIFLLFCGFIIACGTTHIMDIWTLWYPMYWLSGSIKAITAVVSVFTAVELVPLVPQALALKSPAQLEQLNQELQIQITERLRIEEELRKYQNHLEELVNLRTNEITKANEQLQQSEERYRYLVEAIPKLLWTTDINGECDYCNHKWYEYTGLTFEQSSGFGWLAALHPDDAQSAREVWWADAVKTGTLCEHEYRFRRASDNSYRWHLARGLPIKDERGNVVKWLGICTDIDEQKQIQQERTRLLELEQAARAKAETANRIKDEFLAVLSHELRTPLNSILGWSKLLQNPKLDRERVSQAVSTIERNAKLQVQLIEDLLDISRVLQGKLTLNLTNVSLESIISSATETLRFAAESKSIHINTVLEPNLRKVAGDPTRLQQVVWNLLSNAIKFTPNGGSIEVRLSSKTELENNSRSPALDYAEIIVSDTGKGISSEFLPYVFDYFRQADSSTTRKFGGLGLGLAIVRNIVEMHGGTVKAESRGEDQGATFIVRLPLLQNESLSIADEEDHHLLRMQNSSSLANVHILVVDDDADSRDFAAFVLEQDGADVITASSGFEALEVIAQTKLDVLISDISMPGMDGYMLIRQVRSLTPEQGGQIPAIALTAFARKCDQQQVLTSGFQMHLAKPIGAQQLVTVVVKVLLNHKQSMIATYAQSQ
jgi:PAS domain S-box-containing protein